MDGTLAMLDDPRDEPRFARRVLLENDACATVGAHYGPGWEKTTHTFVEIFCKVLSYVSPSRRLRSLDTALVITRAFRETHVTPHSHDHAGMYELVSICSGSSLISTSNRSCTASSTAESSSEPMKVMARPLVPKRPALPTRCRYVSAPSGMS